MLHDQGNPHAARPMRIGVGTCNGSRGARIGSQRCSCSMRGADTARRGRRTASSCPRRNVRLSHPSPASTRESAARSGCCSSSSARTKTLSIAISAAGGCTSGRAPHRGSSCRGFFRRSGSSASEASRSSRVRRRSKRRSISRFIRIAFLANAQIISITSVTAAMTTKRANRVSINLQFTTPTMKAPTQRLHTAADRP